MSGSRYIYIYLTKLNYKSLVHSGNLSPITVPTLLNGTVQNINPSPGTAPTLLNGTVQNVNPRPSTAPTLLNGPVQSKRKQYVY